MPTGPGSSPVSFSPAIDEGFGLDGDPNNCGMCGNVCPVNSICSNGACFTLP